ncbi:MAG: lytic transglycosylase domain-containing protein, partial [Halobacteriovoraceae bacterium]|nr:lytic transglycosylase domain-containing protein [Halobacteriovoraceae bacterium]
EEFKKAYTTSMIDWARAVWTDHRRGEAREKLTRLINSKIEDPENEALIYWLLGVMAIEGKKHRLALDHFEKGNTFDIEDTDLKEKIHWAIGWTYYLQKDYKKAAGFFDTTYHQYDAGGFRNKLHFWAGRSYKKAGESSKATNTWEELLSVDSYGYYGILTHMELGKPLSPLDPGKDQSKNPEIEILEWLIALKETKLSHAFLKSFQKTLVSPSAIKDHLNLFKKAGYYEGGIKNFFKLKGEDRERAMRSHLGSAFPRPYKRSVNRAARKFKISPYLIYSISRQESAFNPSIRSWADAFGVMQMTPERAVILSKRHRVPYNKVGDLFHPKTNILLGTSLLRELKNKFQNKFIATVAGYNASERVVKVWYRQRYNGDPIQFIEMIPYKETQNYVKLVFRNFITYKRLESKDQFLVKSDIFKKF